MFWWFKTQKCNICKYCPKITQNSRFMWIVHFCGFSVVSKSQKSKICKYCPKITWNGRFLCELSTFVDFRLFQNPKNLKSANIVRKFTKMGNLCTESPIFVGFPAYTSEEGFLVLGLFWQISKNLSSKIIWDLTECITLITRHRQCQYYSNVTQMTDIHALNVVFCWFSEILGSCGSRDFFDKS